MGDYYGAISESTTNIVKDESNQDAYKTRGIARLNIAEYPKALADLDQAITLNGHDAEAFYYRAMANLELGLIYHFASHFGQYCKLRLENTDTDKAAEYAAAFKDRATSLLEHDRYEDAIHEMTQAILWNPNDGEAYAKRAEANFRLGLYISYASDYTESLRKGYIPTSEK